MEHLPQDYKTLDTRTGINLVSSYSLYLFKFQFKKDDGVFSESTEHKDNARNDPALYRCETLGLKR